MGFFDPDDEVVTAERVLAHFEAAAGWFAEDRPFTIDRPYVRQVFITVSDPRSEFFEIMKRQTVPPEAMFARRMETLTLAVLGQLEATANWHRIAREWLFGDPPVDAARRGRGGVLQAGGRARLRKSPRTPASARGLSP